MKKTKKMIICLIIVLLISLVSYFIFIKEDKTSTLTLNEKNWIEDNKNTVFDISIKNDIPIFTENSESLFMNFLTKLEEDTKLSFNKITNLEEEYKFTIKDKLSKNDILIHEDNYVLVSKTNKLYKKSKDLPILNIGVIDQDKISKYLNDMNLVEFSSYEEMFTEINNENSKINTIAVPKTYLLDDIISNKLNIIYQINDYKQYYVFSLGDNKKLNTIINKYYTKYKKETYQEIYNTNLSDLYFTNNNISEKEKSDFRSKRYTYGFIDNSPFDKTYTGKLFGINKEYIDSFSEVANIEIKYDKYSSYDKLIKNYNNKKIDFIFNYSDNKKILKSYNTVNNIDPTVVVLSSKVNNITIDSINSLNHKKVITIEDSFIENYLKENKIKYTSYDINKLFGKINDESVIVIDKYIYDTFNIDELKNYKIVYDLKIDSYGYIINDNKDNKVFKDYLNFYITFVNDKKLINKAILSINKTNKSYEFIYDLILYILAVTGIVLLSKKILKPKKKKININKEDKLKYIDRLTSLKNRNYLNDEVEKWDSSGIYPQTIMIIDLNNVAYVNDNFGHKAGDKLIAEAAGILIKNQIINSEIIRTNGNEFLIYLVGYEEKQIVTYKKKLLKELKELEHGFGATIGYSMILDAIKTSDDAINEATLDMKRAKEDR